MPERVLAVLPRDLPGVALCEPALRAVKQSLPRCHLTLCSSRELEPLARLSRHADEVITGNPSSPLFFITVARSRAYRGILFETTLGGAVALRLAKTRRRVGFRKFGLSWLLNRAIRKMPDKFRLVRVRHLVEVVRYFGCEVTDRIPQWTMPRPGGDRKLLITNGARGSLGPRIIADWKAAGFEPVPPATTTAELIDLFGRADRVVGPSDSAVTLARAMGVTSLRLTGRRPPLDDFPGRPVCTLDRNIPATDALGQWAGFLDDNGPD